MKKKRHLSEKNGIFLARQTGPDSFFLFLFFFFFLKKKNEWKC